MNQIQERISKVKSTLIIEQPYFGSIASYLNPDYAIEKVHS